MTDSCEAGSRARAERRLEQNFLTGVAEAWRFTTLLSIHSEVDQVDQNLYMALGLVISAHHSEREKWLVVFKDHGWNKRVERTLSRCDNIRVCGLQVKQCTTIVQDNASVADDEARSEAFEQAVDEGNSISVFIDNREIDGVTVLSKAGARIRYCVARRNQLSAL